MKTLIFSSLILLVFLIVTAKIQITFSPFKISFGSPYFAIGLFFLMIGVSLIKFQGEKDGKKQVLESIEQIHKYKSK